MKQIVIFAFVFPLWSSSSLKIKTWFIEQNNADFRNYNHKRFLEKRYSNKLNSDDRMRSIIGGVFWNSHFNFAHASLFVSLSKLAYWGDDNWQMMKGAPIAVSKLYIEHYFSQDWSIKLGRYYFNLTNSKSELFWADTIDGVEILWKPISQFKLRMMGDILSSSILNLENEPIPWRRKDQKKKYNFNGDTMSVRVGIISSYLYHQIDLNAFTFYLRYGANDSIIRSISVESLENTFEGDSLFVTGFRGKCICYNIFPIEFTLIVSRTLWAKIRGMQDQTGVMGGIHSYWKFFIRKIALGGSISITFSQKDFIGFIAPGPGRFISRNLRRLQISGYAGARQIFSEKTYVFEKGDSVIAKLVFNGEIWLRYKYWIFRSGVASLISSYSKKILGNEIDFLAEWDISPSRLSITLGYFFPSNWYQSENQKKGIDLWGKDPQFILFLKSSYQFEIR